MLICSLIDNTLLRPLQYPDARRLLMMWSVPLGKPDQRQGVMYPNYLAFGRAQAFETVGAIWSQPRNLGVDENGRAEKLAGEGFTPSMLRALGVQPLLGRLLADDEDKVGSQTPVFLISERFWRRRFGGAPDILGKTIRMDGVPITIVGVMPHDFYLWDPEAGYFATLRTPVVQGRDFNDRDTAAAPPLVIIKQAMACRYWPAESPIGRHIELDSVPNEPLREIVGVVADIRLSRQQRQIIPTVYVPHLEQPMQWLGPGWNIRSGMYLILRTNGNTMGLAPAVRQAVADVDRNKPASNIPTVEQYLDQYVQYVRGYVFLLTIFVAVAVILALGVYGVMAYSVVERTREIGIRMALGASSGNVLTLVIRQALVLMWVGLALGLAGSFALTRIIKSALYGAAATDASTFTTVSLLLMVVAFEAASKPGVLSRLTPS
jgi:hypothetical protein